MKTGELIKKARKKSRLTQKELASKLNCSFALVSQYERGDRNPKIETLQKIADALGVSVALLIDTDEIIKASEDVLKSFDPTNTSQLTREEFVEVANTSRRQDTINKYDQLNNAGQHKANEYITDLYENDKYIADDE